jgi:hypothetical protein
VVGVNPSNDRYRIPWQILDLNLQEGLNRSANCDGIRCESGLPGSDQ